MIVLKVLFLLSTATASYRLLPEITITKPCEDGLADKLADCFSEGVIKVETENGTSHAYVIKILHTHSECCGVLVIRHFT